MSRLISTYRFLQQKTSGAPEGEVAPEIESICSETENNFVKAMNDDFNTPSAIAVLFDFSREINKNIADGVETSKPSLQKMCELFQTLAGQVLGILPKEKKKNYLPDLL